MIDIIAAAGRSEYFVGIVISHVLAISVSFNEDIQLSRVGRYKELVVPEEPIPVGQLAGAVTVWTSV